MQSSYISKACQCKPGALALIIVLLVSCFTAQARATIVPSRISFQNILENKDISLGTGGAIFQDSDGFMWLGGSNALVRYDGYEFRQFDLDADNTSEKEAVKFVQFIFEDSSRILWIGTRTGLLQYNPRKEQLTRIPDSDVAEIKLSTSDINQIAELKTGEIIVASLSGLLIVDPVTRKYSAIVPDNKVANGLHSKRVNAVFTAPDGAIWLGTDAGLELLDWAAKTFTLYKPYPERPDLAPPNRVADIAVDQAGKFWLGTSDGLVSFDPKNQVTRRYVNDANDRHSLSGNDIWKLLIDSQGALWIASDGGGISVFDPQQQRFYNNKYEPGRLGSINSNQVRTVFEDNSGDIWVGNYPSGINFFDRSTAPIASYSRDISNPNSLSHNTILSIQEDDKGNLWMGTDGGGLDYFDRASGDFSHFKNDPKNTATISSNAVLATYIDSKGVVWAGTWGGGMSSYDPETRTFTRYPFDAQNKSSERVSTSLSLNSPHVWSIREDKNQELWITTHTGGLNKYNRETKIFTHYPSIENDPDSLSGNVCWNSYEDSKGNFWVGSSTGLNLLDRQTGKFRHWTTDPKDPGSLSNPSVLVIFEDSKKRLWLGTDAGLNLYNPDTQKFTVYDKKNGFNDDTIRHIVEDAAGNFWLSTNNGFSSFNPETKKIKNYTRIGGRLIGGFQTRSGLLSSRGEIILGGVDGLRIFKPGELTDNKNAPPVVLTDFKIFADSVTVGGPDNILKNAVNHTDIIELDYKKSMFVLGFSALNFRDSGSNRYSYKLEGFDDAWLDAGNQRSAKYTNLSAGRYVFRVKGSNNDGVWNEQGKTITIIQLPPPWKTWWAYTLYVLAIVALVGWFVRQQQRKRQLIEEQNRLLEMKVTERTAEVRQKSQDIQAMLSNIPQGLFTVQDGGIIHPEYSLFLEALFATTDIAGRQVNDLLFTQAYVGSDALDSAKAAIFAIIGEDEMNFDFNKSLLLTEYAIEIAGHKKHLALGWSPIIVDGVVNKLMVSVRDVTLIKQMESDAQEQKRQLDIISQLLNLSAEKYLGFEESAKRFIQQNRETIEASDGRNDDSIALLFRNMHTIKGNCRTFGFSYLSNTAHEVESAYSALKSSTNMSWEPEKLLDDLDLVERGLAEYGHVYRTVLGRGDGSGSDRHDGFWMKNAVMDKIQQFLANEEFAQLKTFISKINANTLEQNLVDVIASLSSIALSLDKKTPIVTIDPQNVLIKVRAQELMSDIFAHILRNCVDHGLEAAEERIRSGKNERGSILITAKMADKRLNISVQDDGRGLNIAALFKKGVEIGKWRADQNPDLEDIAQLVFYSGVSTKDAVTDISGRGVGMDAVKQFLAQQGGEVSLILHQEQGTNPAFIPFELVVSLPDDLYFEDAA